MPFGLVGFHLISVTFCSFLGTSLTLHDSIHSQAILLFLGCYIMESPFLISFADCSFLVHRNTTALPVSVPQHGWVCFSSSCVCVCVVCSVGSSVYSIHHRWRTIDSACFQCGAFYFFICLVSLAGTSSPVLSSGSQSRQPCETPHLRWKHLVFYFWVWCSP